MMQYNLQLGTLKHAWTVWVTERIGAVVEYTLTRIKNNNKLTNFIKLIRIK